MFKHKFFLSGMACAAATLSLGVAMGAERPTLKHNTRDPRPDILLHPIWDAHIEYRRTYNRPTFIGGWLAYKVSRTSQEAMVWQENLQAGNYDRKHMPPMYKRYYAPKPWEMLATGPRPDFPDRTANGASATSYGATPTSLPAAQPAPLPEEAKSKPTAGESLPLQLSENSSRRR